MDEEKEILIRGDRRLLTFFLPMLEKGCEIKALVGVTLRALLIDQLGVNNEYVEGKIQTVFLNAKAIDDLDHTVVNSGDVLALSGAMPGLVGATLRKGGKYAVMRREISGSKTRALLFNSLPGKIRIKLFNTVLNDLGPGILDRGVWISTVDLTDLLKMNQRELKEDNFSILQGEKASSLQAVMATIENQDQCRLKVVC